MDSIDSMFAAENENRDRNHVGCSVGVDRLADFLVSAVVKSERCGKVSVFIQRAHIYMDGADQHDAAAR
jgi:hypothetical protein